MKKIGALAMFVVMAGCAEQPAPAVTAEKAEAETQAQKVDEARPVTVAEMSTLLANGQAVPVDANDCGTRAKQGTIPGAVVLSSYKDFEASELPSDKSTKLVFYCYNEKCSAAEAAAKTAQNHGYKDVRTMPAGIKGWSAAGKEVDKKNKPEA